MGRTKKKKAGSTIRVCFSGRPPRNRPRNVGSVEILGLTTTEAQERWHVGRRERWLAGGKGGGGHGKDKEEEGGEPRFVSVVDRQGMDPGM